MVPNPKLLKYFKGPNGPTTAISFHPDGERFVSSSGDSNLYLWSINSNNCNTFNVHSKSATSVEFSPDGNIFASSSADCTVALTQPLLKGTHYKIKAHMTAVNTVCFSRGGDKIYTGSNDKSIKVWDVKTKKFLQSLTGHTNWVRWVQYSPTNDVLASCSDDKTVRIWDCTTGQCIHVFSDMKDIGTNLSMHPNGLVVGVASESGSVRVYDMAAQKLQQHYTLHDHTLCIAWHPDGKYFFTGGQDGKLSIVDAMEGRPLYLIASESGSVKSIALSRDGTRFAYGGDGKCINVYGFNAKENE